jgi:CBS domain-containing protein
MATRDNGHFEQQKTPPPTGAQWTQEPAPTTESASFYQRASERRRQTPATSQPARGEGRYGDYRGEHRYQTRDEGREPYRFDEDRRRRWQKEPLTARDIMTRGVKAVRPDHNLQDAAQVMKDENCGIVPVVDETMRLLGVLTDRDIVIRAAKDDRTPSQVRVSEIMTHEVVCVTGEENLIEVIELMGDHQVRRMPVVDRDDKLIGIVSMGDVANRADYDEELQDALEKISARRSFWNRMFGG